MPELENYTKYTEEERKKIIEVYNAIDWWWLRRSGTKDKKCWKKH